MPAVCEGCGDTAECVIDLTAMPCTADNSPLHIAAWDGTHRLPLCESCREQAVHALQCPLDLEDGEEDE